jgi:hypothetical protein
VRAGRDIGERLDYYLHRRTGEILCVWEPSDPDAPAEVRARNEELHRRWTAKIRSFEKQTIEDIADGVLAQARVDSDPEDWILVPETRLPIPYGDDDEEGYAVLFRSAAESFFLNNRLDAELDEDWTPQGGPGSPE